MSCAECYSGHVRAGVPKGIEVDIHGTKAYVVNPEPGEENLPVASIVVISDAFGWDTNNIRLLADSYAKRTACRVYVPDFMHGTAAPQWIMKHIDRIFSEGGLWGWIVKPWLVAQAIFTMLPFRYRNHPPNAYPKVKQFMNDFRCVEGANAKVGVVGFCWGGYHVTHLAHGELAANGKTLIDAAFAAHPSELTIPKDIQDVKLPYSVSVGDVDFAMPMKEVEAMNQVLKESQDLECEVVVIPNAKHGFAVRADPNDQAAMEMADHAENQAVNWFVTHLRENFVASRED